jgi:hypothetical protein
MQAYRRIRYQHTTKHLGKQQIKVSQQQVVDSEEGTSLYKIQTLLLTELSLNSKARRSNQQL